MTEQKDENLIDLTALIGNFLKALIKFRLPVLAVTAALAVGYLLFSWISYTPYYESQATFSINTQDSSLVLGGSSGSAQLKESLPYILQSQYMKNLVMEDLELTSFPATISLESKELANFFVLRVTAQDPHTADDVLDSVIQNCPRASVYVLGKISLEVLDESGIPSAPVNRLSKARALIVGGMAGLFLCAAAILFYVLTKRTIETEDDLKKYLSTSCLAALPQITFKKRRKQFNKYIHIKNDKVGGAFIETVRTMRSRVQHATEKTGAKTILVTSSVPSEGKSTVAANLALALAEKGEKTVLVDLDLRNPSVHEVLGLKRKKSEGVVDILKGTHSWEQLLRHERAWNLCVLPGGVPQSNTIDLLNTEALSGMLPQLRERFDYIILDTPPAAMLADAAAIARHVDCAIYVVKQDYARVERIAEGMETLNLSKVPIIGVVLNGVEKVTSRYGGYHSYRYGGYGGYGHYGAYGEHKDTADGAPDFIDLENPWEE